jgi:proton glutamate symport protein
VLIAASSACRRSACPGSISFVVSIGPIALAMGVPVEPLALLVAVEMLPDLMRTLGNVTMNVAVTARLTARHDDNARKWHDEAATLRAHLRCC